MAGCASASGARLSRSGASRHSLEIDRCRGCSGTFEVTAGACVIDPAWTTRSATKASLEATVGPRTSFEAARAARATLEGTLPATPATSHARLTASALPAALIRTTLGAVLIEGLPLFWLQDLVDS